MSLKNTSERYGIITILIHWLSALLVLFMLALGSYMVDLPNGDPKWEWYGLHKAIGIIIISLTLLRILWKLINITPPLPANTKRYESILSHSLHGFLYLLLILIPISGYIDSSAGGYGIHFFGLFDIPLLIDKNKELSDTAGMIHGYLGYALVACIALHLAAALKHHFVLKDNILRRMLP